MKGGCKMKDKKPIKSTLLNGVPKGNTVFGKSVAVKKLGKKK